MRRLKYIVAIAGVMSINLSMQSPNMDKLIHYTVLSSGDTINRMMTDSIKEGKWFEESGTGLSYYYEVGDYISGMRFGEWRKYNDADELIETSQYFRGAKNGINVLYSKGVAYAYGEQVGMFYTQDKDTIMVTDPDDLLQYATEIKNNSYALRHGDWYFRNPFTRDTTRIITYHFGHVINEVDLGMRADAVRDSIVESRMPHKDPEYKPIKKKPRRYHFPN